MGKDFKLKCLITLILFITCSLAILNFVVSLFSHSSVISLTALINLSQFNFYLTKHKLLVYKKKNISKSSRFGILIDLINSIFVCATCFSILIKSIQSLAGHHDIHDLNQDNDKLHHIHQYLKPNDKENLMLTTGFLTFSGDFLIFVIFLILNSRQNRNDTSLIPERNDRVKSFEPFNDIKVKKENCVLIIPSDLVKCRNKFLDIIVLFIGPTFTILCVFLNKIDLEKHVHHEELNGNVTHLNETIDHHEHNESNNHVKTLSDFLVINIDPILSIIITLFYFYFFVSILRVSFMILSQAVPVYINIQSIKTDLMKKIPTILNIHDLHLYEFNPFHLCVSMHFVIKNNNLNSQKTQIKLVSDQIVDFFSTEYFIFKVILQPEVVEEYNERDHENGCVLSQKKSCIHSTCG